MLQNQVACGVRRFERVHDGFNPINLPYSLLVIEANNLSDAGGEAKPMFPLDQ